MVPLNRIPGPALETPCRASCHHSYAGMPRRGIAAAVLTSWSIFSSRVRREMRSHTLMVMGNCMLQNGNVLVIGFAVSQANGGLDDSVAESPWLRRRRNVK